MKKKKKKFFLQYIRNYSDILTVYEIFGEQDYNIDKFIHEKLKLKLGNSLFNNLIIDCGSNIGSSVEFFSRTYPNARIVGLEPEINNFKFSKKNISSEKHLILNNAICSEKKKLKLNINKVDERSFHITKDKDGVDVEGLTVKNILDNFSNDCRPFLIKIDIEGYESELFKDNFEWIDDFQIIIIEIHDWMLLGQSNSSNFINALNIIMKHNNKRDLFISGENLVSIKINE